MKNYIHNLNNQKGSAILISIIGVAILAISVFAAMQISNSVNADSQRARVQDEVASFTQSIRMLASNGDVCFNGVDGDAGQAGLRFMTETGLAITTMNMAEARSANGQKIHFGSNFPYGPGVPLGITSYDTISPADQMGMVSDFNLKLNRLAIKVDASQPNFPGRIVGQLVARLESTRIPGYAMPERLLTNIVMNVDGTGNISNCVAEDSNLTPASMCSSMGCNYNPDLEGQKCICPLPVASCGVGEYIKGLDPATLRPVCASISLSCTGGRFLAGVKPNGDPACSDVVPPPAPAAVSDCTLDTIVDRQDLFVDCQATIANLMASGFQVCEPTWTTGTQLNVATDLNGKNRCVIACAPSGDWGYRQCVSAPPPPPPSLCPSGDPTGPYIFEYDSCTVQGEPTCNAEGKTFTNLCVTGGLGFQACCESPAIACYTREMGTGTPPLCDQVSRFFRTLNDCETATTNSVCPGGPTCEATEAFRCAALPPPPPPPPVPEPTSNPIGCLRQNSCSGTQLNRTTYGLINNVSGVLEEPTAAEKAACTAAGGTCLDAEVVDGRGNGYTGIYRLFCSTGTPTDPYALINGSGTFACGLTAPPAPQACTPGDTRLDRKRCCQNGSSWSSTPMPPTPGATQYDFCGCGNSPEWWMIRNAAGMNFNTGC